MSSEFFAKFDGVQGESTRKGHKGEIDVLSWSWGAAQPSPSAAGAGAGAGKVVPSPFTFVHRYDRASPVLARSCATGEHFKDARLSARTSGKGQGDYLVITMEEVVITSVQVSASQGGDVVETVECAYGDIEFSYSPQDAKGGFGDVVTFGWDVAADDKV